MSRRLTPVRALPAITLTHTDRERRRLALEASIINPLTIHLLHAGVSEGMHALDLGCRVGDMHLIAGQLVGALATANAPTGCTTYVSCRRSLEFSSGSPPAEDAGVRNYPARFFLRSIYSSKR